MCYCYVSLTVTPVELLCVTFLVGLLVQLCISFLVWFLTLSRFDGGPIEKLKLVTYRIVKILLCMTVV
jgi:hypothetical protein